MLYKNKSKGGENMDSTEREIIYSTDERFDLIKNLCHLSKNLYNASLYDVRQYYFETKSYRTWQSQAPLFSKNKQPDYYALQSHLAQQVLMQVGRQFLSFFNNKSNKKKRIPKYKDKNGYNVITFNKVTISRQVDFDEDRQIYTYTLCKRSYNLKIKSTKPNVKMVKFVYDEVNDLIKWKNSKYRKPLILKGVRQVGKTWILKEFGNRYYENIAYFNFDENPEYRQFFQTTKDINRILQNLILISGYKIVPEKTLIIFDEVQDVPEVINSLKYFYENTPEYHIACAGSLLGIALAKPSSYNLYS